MYIIENTLYVENYVSFMNLKVSFHWNNWNYSRCRNQIPGHQKFPPFHQEEIPKIPKENTCSYTNQPLEGDDDQVLTALIRILGLVFRLVPNYSQCFCECLLYRYFLFCPPAWPKLQELILPVGIVILVEMSFFPSCQCVFHGGVFRTLLEN